MCVSLKTVTWSINGARCYYTVIPCSVHSVFLLLPVHPGMRDKLRGCEAIMKVWGLRAPVCSMAGPWGPRLGRAGALVHLELDGKFVGAK